MGSALMHSRIASHALFSHSAQIAPAAVSAYTAQGAVLSVCPGRVAYHHSLKGPAVAVDTACSSSLVALNSGAARQGPACRRARRKPDAASAATSAIAGPPSPPAAREWSLRSGGAALAGGINMMLSASTTFMFKRAGMLSADGRCKALDAAADGYVRSEACALALLSAGPVADSHGTPVLLAGTAVNQGGRASSLTAPNGPSQQEVVRMALAAAGLAVRQMAGLQLHGTGTSLGDPIEVGAAAGECCGACWLAPMCACSPGSST